ncbi:unnamed protein product [Protopolystoma xenopodis]|uniref:Uncharacterized protein n=1 Tax=Protopolystoma xenopodis TaxID=117903 RepID=A0A448XN37_9PLAT|nr:unnamed protein product [Protopolystoma xenopodis]
MNAPKKVRQKTTVPPILTQSISVSQPPSEDSEVRMRKLSTMSLNEDQLGSIKTINTSLGAVLDSEQKPEKPLSASSDKLNTL